MIKKYIQYIKEAINPNRQYQGESMRYYVNMLEKIIEQTFNILMPEIDIEEEEWDEDDFDIDMLPDVFKMILEEYFGPEEYINGRLIPPEDRTWTLEYAKARMDQFVGAWLMDDGENKLEDGVLKDAIDGNITQHGTCLWVLEKLGYDIPCIIVYNYKIIAETKTFNDALKIFDDICIEREIQEYKTMVDSAGKRGKFEMSIIGVIPE